MCDLELNLLFNLGRHTDSAQKCGLERYFQLGSQACRANAGISRIALGRADRSHRQVYEMTRRAAISPMIKSGDPNGIRTRVTAVKGRCPRPLDDRVTKPPNIPFDSRKANLPHFQRANARSTINRAVRAVAPRCASKAFRAFCTISSRSSGFARRFAMTRRSSVGELT